MFAREVGVQERRSGTTAGDVLHPRVERAQLPECCLKARCLMRATLTLWARLRVELFAREHETVL